MVEELRTKLNLVLSNIQDCVIISRDICINNDSYKILTLQNILIPKKDKR